MNKWVQKHAKGGLPGWLLIALSTVALLVLNQAEPALAASVGIEQAKGAVNGWLKADRMPLREVMGQTIQGAVTINDAQGAILCHVISLDPEGFVIVSADDLIEPVIAFSPSGQFDPSSKNPLGALVSRDLPGRLARVKGMQAADQGALSTAHDKWIQLLAFDQAATRGTLSLSSLSDVRVAPLTQTLWDQQLAGGSACYNYFTPPYAAGNNGNYYCGCVATAMAQLMRYWQFPVNGVGIGSFTISVSGATTSRSLRGGDGLGGGYLWTNMVLNPVSSTIAQRQAIGALCHDAAVSVGMDFTSTGSSADTLEARTQLVNTFRYANAIKGYNTGSTIGTGLNAMVNPNLDAGCPVLFGISDGLFGHAIVGDGYGYNLSTLYHHLNMGWSGSDTAWYNLPNIDVADPYNSVYKCVYNVWTNGTGEIISGRVLDGSGAAVAGAAVTAIRSGGATYTATTGVSGIYAFAHIPSSSTYTVRVSVAGSTYTNRIVTTGLSVDNSATSGNRWGLDFIAQDSLAPTGLTVTVTGATQLSLSWGKNLSNDNVVVAWSTNGIFGIPSNTLAVGSSMAGGGVVLYNGNGTNLSHTNLTAGTFYYYRAWSVRSGPTYSSGVSKSGRTANGIPFSEGFETAAPQTNGWSEEFVTNSASWINQTGGYNSSPPNAHAGSRNALLYFDVASDHKTKLVTPQLDFGAATLGAQVSFWHCMENWSPDQDELRVYSKTNLTGAWTLLATYTNAVSSWTKQTLSLPNPNSSTYIAFEGNAKYGYGVCVDDVLVSGSVPPNAAPTGISLSGLSVLENLPAGTTVGTLGTTDQDTGNTFIYALTNGTGGSDNGSFTISGSNLLTAALFDYETKSNYSLRVKSTDQGGLSTQEVFTVTVTDVDERPVFTAPMLQTNDTLVLHWASVTNHLYSVYGTTNMATPFSLLESNIIATPSMNSYTDTLSGARQKFWKITTVP